MRSLRARLFAAILGTVLLCVGVSLLLGVALTRAAVQDSILNDLARQVYLVSIGTEALQNALGDSGAQLPPGQPPPGANAPGQPPAGANPPGQPPPNGAGVAPPGATPPRLVTLTEAQAILPAEAVRALRAGRPAQGTFEQAGDTRLFAARAQDNRVVLVTRPGIRAGDYSRYLTALLIACALGVLLAGIAAALLARRIATPMQRVAAASRELAAGRTPDPLPQERTTELAELAGSFNDMAHQLDRAREAERAVLLSVSHELRTPLTAIRGYAEGIEDGTIEPTEAARVVMSESARLERLVADLLALARLEQGALDVRHEPIDLSEAAREAERRLAPRARDEGVVLEVQANGPAPAVGDPDRAVQVISNLVENAVRMTPSGGRVTIAAQPGSVEVADTGPGIPADDLPRAFERFHLHRRTGSGSPDGSGLGLAIVQELTQAMGGTVAVESPPGEGARFVVTLPTG